MNYATMENELLSIVATLQEFRSMLLGAKLIIYTDLKNLTFDTLNNQRVLHWQSCVEEYPPMLHYIEGEKNILAGNLSCIHRLSTPKVDKTGRALADQAGFEEIDEIDGYFLDQYYTGVSDEDLRGFFEC